MERSQFCFGGEVKLWDFWCKAGCIAKTLRERKGLQVTKMSQMPQEMYCKSRFQARAGSTKTLQSPQ